MGLRYVWRTPGARLAGGQSPVARRERCWIRPNKGHLCPSDKMLRTGLAIRSASANRRAPDRPAARRRQALLAERCRSGRTGRSRKPLCPYGYRGFESLPLRHIAVRCDLKRSQAALGFLGFSVWKPFGSTGIAPTPRPGACEYAPDRAPTWIDGEGGGRSVSGIR